MGIVILCIIFVCVYGEHYDWYESVYIRMATAGGVVVLLLNLWRASFIRHPFIALVTGGLKPFTLPFALYGCRHFIGTLALARTYLYGSRAWV